MMWNLVFLGTVSGLPFSSAVVGRNGDLFLGWTLYASNMVFIGLALTMLVHHAIRHGLLRPDVQGPLERFLRLRALATPLVFGLSILVALFDTASAELTPLLLIAYNAALSARFRDLPTGRP
jgi:uncharacterized membrane protein